MFKIAYKEESPVTTVLRAKQSRRNFVKRMTASFALGAGGLYLPRLSKAVTGTAYMTNTANGMAQSLLNGCTIKRPFLNLGGNFSVLRVGIRCSINGSSLPGGTTGFQMGVMHGTTDNPFTTGAANSLSVGQTGGTWTFAGSGTTARYKCPSMAGQQFQNLVFKTPNGGPWGCLECITAKTHSASPCIIMFETIVSGAAWKLRVFMPQQDTTATTPTTHTDLATQMVATTPSLTGYCYNNSIEQTTQVDPAQGTWGIFDTAYFCWIQTIPLEVVDFMVTYNP